MESDAKITNPFFRGFRRENSDFFPMSSARHSAIFAARNAQPLRSSGIFNKFDLDISRLNKQTDSEPVLMEFVKRNSDSPTKYCNENINALKSIAFLPDSKLNFLKPRREKTESDIILRNASSKQCLQDNLKMKRLESDNKFSKHENEFGRRSSRPLDINITNSSAKPADGEEYIYLKVIRL